VSRLIHENLMQEQVVERQRRAERARLAQDTRAADKQRHRREVQRVRDSLLLVADADTQPAQEA
jgi:hypothetical protein